MMGTGEVVEMYVAMVMYQKDRELSKIGWNNWAAYQLVQQAGKQPSNYIP